MDPQKIYLVTTSLQLVEDSSILSNNPTAMLVGDSIAISLGKSTPFMSVGQTIKGTFTDVEQNTGKTKEQSKSFVVSRVIQPIGNNFIDRSVIINEVIGNSLFHISGKYDQMVVAALSCDLVPTNQGENTGLYGKNIGVMTAKAISQTIQRFQSGNSAFTIAIAFIAILVDAVGIIATSHTFVTERTKEIGTMKAIGAKCRFILMLFLSEALLIGMTGASVGLLTGMCGPCLLTSGFVPKGPRSGGAQSTAPPHISPVFIADQLLNVWILSVSLSRISGIFPAWNAARLSPLKRLEDEWLIGCE